MNLTMTAAPASPAGGFVTADVRLWTWDGVGSWSLLAETILSVGVPYVFTPPAGAAIVLPPAPAFAVPPGTIGGPQVEPGVDAPGTPGDHYDPRPPDAPTYTPQGLALRGLSPTPTPTPLSVFVVLLDRKSGVYAFTAA